MSELDPKLNYVTGIRDQKEQCNEKQYYFYVCVSHLHFLDGFTPMALRTYLKSLVTYWNDKIKYVDAEKTHLYSAECYRSTIYSALNN